MNLALRYVKTKRGRQGTCKREMRSEVRRLVLEQGEEGGEGEKLGGKFCVRASKRKTTDKGVGGERPTPPVRPSERGNMCFTYFLGVRSKVTTVDFKTQQKKYNKAL